jgi:hypothetical protein
MIPSSDRAVHTHLEMIKRSEVTAVVLIWYEKYDSADYNSPKA